MSASDTQNNDNQEHAAAGPGMLLRAARVERGMGIADVASTLRIPVSVVEKLEADDYQGLPPDTFTRGYVRAYARLLEMDAEAVLARYPAQAEGAYRPLRVAAPVRTSPDITPGLVRTFLAGGVLVVLVGLGVWFYPFEEEDGGLAGEPAVTVPADPVPQSADLLTESERAGAVDPDADTMSEPEEEQFFTDELAGPPVSQVPDHEDVGVVEAPSLVEDSEALAFEVEQEPSPEESEPTAEGGLVAEQGTVLAQELQEPEPAVQPEPVAVASDELELEFSGPSWVEVYDAEGERLLYGLIQDQGRERVRGSAPFSVVIGDANHVALVYQGEPVDLGQVRPGRVVRTRVPN